ncbi:hypothetical protein EUGRSUZ_L03680 [Eucalyptus grandis]|uniref:Uncharacterized protein n=1 Tax=Eucalyptus grandis TaxID=71139 RepID=A0AAD9T7W7_EUCGR|nr:hypothetical protein EUGRSUZ_L03680 [Eucalyptus grandis]
MASCLAREPLSREAALPARATPPLSACYELRRASSSVHVEKSRWFLNVGFSVCELKTARLRREVPARGKALVPTDLSIAIPEGTCAGVANVQLLISKHCLNTLFWMIDEG